MNKYIIGNSRMRHLSPLNDDQINDYQNKTYSIIGAAMNIYNELGPGFSEPVYQECMKIVCDEQGIPCDREVPLTMYFHDKALKKEYQADMVCYGNIIVEFKAVSKIIDSLRAQLFNYLRITQMECGVLINFGEADGLHVEKYLYNPLKDKFELFYFEKK